MSIYEDEAHTKQIESKNRSLNESTRGFRHITEIHLDDLTFRVLKHFEAIGEREFFEREVLSLGENVIQSPIERAVFSFLLLGDYAGYIERDQIEVVLPGDSLPERLSNEIGIAICPQHRVGNYYLDFGLFMNLGDHKLAFDIECDGIEFHGKTNEQTSHDFLRDNVVSENRFQIYRMPGAGIVRHPLYEIEKFFEEVSLQITALRAAA